MKLRRILATIIALLSAATCVAQNQRPGPDPLQRSITQARNAGNLADAEKFLRDGIRDLQQRDPKSERLASYLKQLSSLVMRRGDRAEGEALLQQSYEIDLSNYGPDDVRITVDLGNMAQSAHRAGDDQRAEQLFIQVLQIVRLHEAEIRLLNDAEYSAGAVAQVISYYIGQKRWVDAEVLMPEVEKLCDLIPEEIREGYSCGNLNAVRDEIYEGEGRHAESAQLSPESPYPPELDALNKAAAKFADDKVYPSAEDTYRRAILIAERLDTDPQSRFNGGLAMSEMEFLGHLYENEGAKDTAEQEYLAAQEIREKRAGSEPSQRSFAMSLNPASLVNLYRNEGRFQDAENILEHSIELQIKYLGEKHRNVVDTITSLAGVYEQEGLKEPAHYAKARAEYEKAISLQESMVGPQHPQLLFLLGQYARLLGTMHDSVKQAEVEGRIAAISGSAPYPR